MIDAYLNWTTDPCNASVNDLCAEITQYARNLCKRRSIPFADAEDIVQSATLDIWTRLSEFDPARSSFPTWVTWQIRTHITAQRRSSATADKISVALSPSPEPETGYTAPELIRKVRAASGSNLELIDLVLALGDVADAADQLGITLLAAQKRLKRLGQKINLDERSKYPLCLP